MAFKTFGKSLFLVCFALLATANGQEPSCFLPGCSSTCLSRFDDFLEYCKLANQLLQPRKCPTSEIVDSTVPFGQCTSELLEDIANCMDSCVHPDRGCPITHTTGDNCPFAGAIYHPHATYNCCSRPNPAVPIPKCMISNCIPGRCSVYYCPADNVPWTCLPNCD